MSGAEDHKPHVDQDPSGTTLRSGKPVDFRQTALQGAASELATSGLYDLASNLIRPNVAQRFTYRNEHLRRLDALQQDHDPRRST